MPIPSCRVSPLSWSNQAQLRLLDFELAIQGNTGEVRSIQLIGLLAIFMCGLLYRDSSGCDQAFFWAWALCF